MLASFLTVALTACQHTKILDPNTATVRMTKAVPFAPVSDGYFVPDSTMLKILDQLGEKDVSGNGK